MKLSRHRRTQIGYFSLSLRLQRLQDELACKQKELAALEQQNGLLQTKHDIISTIADTVEFIYADAVKRDGINGLLPEEEELLQQLRAMRQRSGEDSPLQCSGEGNPLHYTAQTVLEQFKYVYTMPRYPGAADMTLNSYLAEFGARVRDLALSLMLHQNQQRYAAASGGASEADEQLQQLGTAETECGTTCFYGPPPLERLKSGLFRLFNLNMSVALAGRHNLAIAAIVTSCDDPTVKLAEAPYQRYLRAITLLELTREQRCALVDAAQVFKALLDSNQQEMQRIASRGSSSGNRSSSREVAAGGSSEVAACSSGSGGVTATAASGSCMPSSGNEQPGCHEEQTSALLRVVLRKSQVIWRVMYGYVFGQLTLVQIAELFCLVYPFMPAVDVILQAVVEYHTQQEGRNE